ncbi:bifunctional adenosylcobinamide kinase/adenosylcobinamide-phosphate guanylyltransferase [Halalkalibacter krulwichiae]|uniref:Bifunctional adenosylcobalamin biosynthesis protein CobU n=1 Tax=Halalkalibacter krulwichiae TaxID=199441 RepID=A0A1X9MA10_9BACI|nr:bifunctional adenosylcobinamide kinase/adenosylcobinamide-phosphate guanylyltransferase [Halalkalibacter krulwichiae]ARK30255.1 Bifunctional adenosylcobalamin biosynthesis protein CobU [Halalkalibacter krulwichiae]
MTWVNSYDELLASPVNTMNGTVIIYGIEAVIQSFMNDDDPRKSFYKWLDQWLNWEKETAQSKLVLIGVDVGKGVVPIEKEKRNYRDLVGWCYQDVVKEATRVDIIWYGLNQQLK